MEGDASVFVVVSKRLAISHGASEGFARINKDSRCLARTHTVSRNCMRSYNDTRTQKESQYSTRSEKGPLGWARLRKVSQ